VKRALKILGVLLGLAVLAAAWPAWNIYTGLQKSASEDPLVWEDDIRALEERSAGRFGPGEAVVFVGSSSIRFWSTLEADMAPMPVLQHGFGGAKLGDVVYYAQRLVKAWQPRAVVVFAGTNDITPEDAKPADVLFERYLELVAILRADDPELPVFYIGITPSPLRWEVWPEAQDTNALIESHTAAHPGLYFIDTAPALLGANGTPNPNNYVWDGLHLSEQGYAGWAWIIRAVLEENLGPT
jgi:hypothetical protein